jgi:hypothetical protein
MRSQTDKLMIFGWICFFAAFIALVLAQEHEQLLQRAKATDIPRACGMQLIWPPLNSIVLFATDSRETTVYFKLWGNCSRFLRQNHNNPMEMTLESYILIYDDADRRNRNMATFELVNASPLRSDTTPVHYRAIRSPLLVRNRQENLHYDTTGHDASKEFSIWLFTLIYPNHLVSAFGAQDDVNDPNFHMVLELHLLSNSTVPVSDISASPNIIKFLALGKPTSHFYAVSPRYTT